MTMGSRILAAVASLKLTLVGIAVLAAVLLWAVVVERPVGMLPVAPLALLFVNLSAAVAVHERLRRQTGLLVFHLGLAALALVAAVGRLLAFDGHVEVTEGALLEVGQIVADSQAPFHPWGLDEALFIQQGFTIDYDPGMRRRHTRSTVSVPDGRGGWQERVVGDDHPLALGGYRFYTSSNKGFAPVVTWERAGAAPVTGAVHMPSYPINEDRQGNEWALPDGSGTVALWLELARPAYDEHAKWVLAAPADAKLVVIDGDRREVLEPGQSVAVGAGRIRYDGVTTWMGYKIFYDPSLPWLAAAAGVAVLGLAWHALLRLRAIAEGPAWREMADVG